MTDKQYVQSIYPDAVCHYFSDKVISPYYEYIPGQCFVSRMNENGGLPYAYDVLGLTFKDPLLAWKQARYVVDKRMLQKLETTNER